jgi:tetratricopeptide (TPR) repeat protein
MLKDRTHKKPLRNPVKDMEVKTAALPSDSIKTGRLELIFAIFIAILGLLLYFNTIFNEYALDDLAVIQENRFTKQGFAGIPVLLRTFYWEGYWNNNSGLYRPLSMITFAVEWQFFPGNPHAGHVTNVLLYAITGFLLFRMLRRMMAKENILLPFIISILFIAHPLHTEVVANIKSRDEILCLLLFILAAGNFLVYVDKGGIWRLGVAVTSYFLCLFAKESALALLLVFPLILFFFRQMKVKRILTLVLPFLITAAVYFLIRMTILGTHVVGKEYTYLDNSLLAAPDLATRLATAFYMLGKYLKLLVFPHPLSYDYSFLEIPFVRWDDFRALIPFLIYSSGFIYSVRCLLKKDKKLFAFGILFYLLSLAVAANVLILIGCTMAERFLYIPSLGFCILVTYGIFRIFPENKGKRKVTGLVSLILGNKWVCLIALLILVPFSVQTIARNPDWKNNDTLFVADANSAPGSNRVKTNYGCVLLQKYDKNSPDKEQNLAYLNKAIAEFDAAIKIDPNHPTAYFDMGVALYEKNDYNGAIDNLKNSIRLDPHDPKPYTTLGNAYYRIHDYSNAIINLKKSIELKNISAETYNFLGGSYFGTGDFRDAVDAYQKAIGMDPKNTELFQNLGSVYGAMGDYTAALLSFHKANELKPDNIQALILIGMTFRNLGKFDSAEFYEREVTKIQHK